MRANDPWNSLDGRESCRLPWILLTAVACCCVATLRANAADEVATPNAPPVAVVQQHRPVLDQRVALMSAELGLDERQLLELRRILINQRTQIMKLWNDTSVPPASRVGATRVISNQTGDQIRALLNDEQRAKYNQPRKPRDAAADPDARSVEDWMKATSRN